MGGYVDEFDTLPVDRYLGGDHDELPIGFARSGVRVPPHSGKAWFTASPRSRAARAAWRRYGKGRHPAGLNFGDLFAYALARASGEDLLCTGDDFAETDIALA